MTYPVLDFPVPAGVTSFATHVVAQPRLTVDFTDEFDRTNTTIADIDNISGFRARITSLNGEDFGEMERVELRVCPVGQGGGCQFIDLMFSVDDLFRRNQQVINLSPQLRNFRELYLGSDQVRMEIVFFPAQTTSRTIEARLEWAIQAVGNLE